MNGTSEYSYSDLRGDPTYLWWYFHSIVVHPFLATTVVPIVVLCALNFLVFKYVINLELYVTFVLRGQLTETKRI